MNKGVLKIVINLFLICGLAGIVAGSAKFIPNQISTFGIAMLKIANPSILFNEYQNVIDTHNNDSCDNTITAPIQQSKPTMRPIKAKDSEADMDIANTPQDILDLMEEAKLQYDEANTDGKTSEENYFGGGELVSFNDIEVQSKIPSSFYSLNIEDLLNKGSNLIIEDKSQPTILVYHSHTTEAYSLLDTGFYNNANSRSNDAQKSVVRVGEEIVRYLEYAGFNVIHDKEIHDVKYGESYASSKASVMKYLEEYPTIQITIDVHRDTITYSNKTKVKPTVKINDKKAARMMIISGCEYGRVKDFPNWEENLKFNLAIQQSMAEKYSGLMRPVMFSERKYNMNLTPTSFLLEVGTDANTLEEACYSGRLFGKALGELLNSKYVKEG